ncbi:ankyrin repeat protein [Sporothrix schenckii 1099-18]|uniref:Ankyrin repeat protein n=1 Tax=Sporothrix schenckii 1099-18 TaxID=1397361 RepID=A0A0F2MEA5_SPOSC|nr:ankyrin repeat protein [Sporothrix schenckii 1099-18]KJR87190.1 ankyrin repeat protein [Sporothrix schenckii 1099-18]
MAGFREKLQKWRDRKGGGRAQPDAASVASSAKGSNDIRQERSGDNLVDPVNRKESSTTQSLWDRAYDALRKEKTQLVKDYEKLLSKEEQMANSTLSNGSPAQPIPRHDVTLDPDSQYRQAQLKTVIEQGLRRMEEKKARYTIAGHEFVLTDQIAQAAGFVLWAKDWIGEAVKASPEASVAWAGVCIILPLLTNPKTTEDANRDGFTYVTTRMRYYAALEPLLLRLGQNSEVADGLMAEANSHIVDLYQQILEFQIRSVLRFYQHRLEGYAGDVFRPRDWEQMRLKIEQLEATVNGNLNQINQFVSRQELESLDKTSTESLGTIRKLLSVSEQQLRVQEAQRDIIQEQLKIQKDAVQQKLSDKQEACLQLFYLTNNKTTYEWYKDRVEDRVEDTCLWFLQHRHFQEWLKQESGPLLVSADPGCGKSVLAKYLIDYEIPRSATTCYFFFKDQDQNTIRQALCALLHQLFSKKPALIEHAMGLFREKGPRLIDSTESLWTILGNAVQDQRAGPVVIVLDALDECAEEEFKDLILNVDSQFRSNQSGYGKLKYLLTSRPYEQIVSKFRGRLDAFPHIRIPGEEESEIISQEVNLVIQYRVEQLAREEGLSNQVKRHLAERLLGIEHRTYLWVYLVFDYLKTGFKKTVKGIEAAIKTLPENVNQVYERILNKSKEDPMVQKVLSIILAASRPLTLSEMNVATNIDDQLQSIHDLDLEEEEAFKSRLRSWCGLFVSIHHNRVYFLHQTAREFLTDSPSPTAVSLELRWHRSITTRHAHTVLAELCVFYLNNFNSDISLTTTVNGASGHDNDRVAFLNYSANYWGFHFHEAGIVDDAAIVPLASGICDPDSKSHLLWSKIYCKIHWLNPKYFTGLIVASYFGHNSVVKLLLEKRADVEAKDNDGRTPLSHAAQGGHEAVARLLLEKGAGVEAKDNDGLTPLSSAVLFGYEAVARLLLEKGADVEAKDNYSLTPLSSTALFGYEAVARLLLEKGADVEAKDNDGRTPLSHAAQGGHEAVVKLLKSHDARS